MRVLFFLVLVTYCLQTKANTTYTDSLYEAAFSYIGKMLTLENEISFKKAVFATENAYADGKLSYSAFDKSIGYLTDLAKHWIKANPQNNYPYTDSNNLYKNIALFRVIKDTINVIVTKNLAIKIQPFEYNFNDFLGTKDWASMFVTKLIETHEGNCHSLPYLYKILADELGATCWLSFAPYHIYIKNSCQGTGCYNTELTSGQFPVDAWIMASGYVSSDAIRSGIYMDTISNQQAVANCALDLAKGYERKYKIYTDSFIVKCCDMTLKYHPNNINAIIYKAEILKKMYLIYKKENSPSASTIYQDMEKLYIKALDLGYKEMPDEMYRQWLESIRKQKNKYNNKRIVSIVRSKA